MGGLGGQATLSWFCCVLSVLAAATFFFMPESPQFLVIKGRRAEAEDALRWLRTGSSAPAPKGEPSPELTSRARSGERPRVRR